MESFIAGLPKAELHLHIEGTFEPELMFAIAKRNQITLPYSSVEELRTAYQFRNLQDFLDLYYTGTNVLLEEVDFFDLTYAYFAQAQKNKVLHAEIFFDPQAHTERGVAFSTAIEGILRGMEQAKIDFGITSKLILSFLRHLSEEEAFKTLEQAKPYLNQIVAVGLDSTEVGNPPSKFERVFAEAIKMGLKTVAHAGEEGSVSYIWEALDLLHVDRIDHGNCCVDDDVLVERLVAEKIPLTVCPLSNYELKVVNDMAQHPVKAMLDKNIQVTINSDDPSYFGGYMNANYQAVAENLNLTKDELIRLAKNSFRACFLSDDEIEKYLIKIDQYIG